MPGTPHYDVVIAGGGLLGVSIAYGLRRQGLRTLILDEGDVAHRASRGNFGLVWLQSKGANCPEYAHWSYRAILGWPEFAAELEARSGIALGYRRPGGYHMCLDDGEYEKRASMVNRLHNHQTEGARTVMLDRADLEAAVPGLGPDVVGASWNPLDGDCNSLALFRALHHAYARMDGAYRPGSPATAIARDGGAYRVTGPGLDVAADKVVLAAGLGLDRFAEMLGFQPFVRPEKGQILVTERVREFPDVLLSQIRHTPDGTVLIGDTKEEAAGYDDRSTVDSIRYLADRAMRIFPHLGRLNIVRSWGALRVMTLDGHPVYDESPAMPGVYVATTHSGVTLAPAHADALTGWIAGGDRPPELTAFGAGRFRADSSQTELQTAEQRRIV